MSFFRQETEHVFNYKKRTRSQNELKLNVVILLFNYLASTLLSFNKHFYTIAIEYANSNSEFFKIFSYKITKSETAKFRGISICL